MLRGEPTPPSGDCPSGRWLNRPVDHLASLALGRRLLVRADGSWERRR
jgi:hypothetical protein